MIIAMRAGDSETNRSTTFASGYESSGIRRMSSAGAERTVIAAVGHGDKKEHIESLKSADGVEDAFPILQPFKLVSREVKTAEVGDPRRRLSRSATATSSSWPGPARSRAREQLLDDRRRRSPPGARRSCAAAPSNRAPRPTIFRASKRKACKLLAEARERTGLPGDHRGGQHRRRRDSSPNTPTSCRSARATCRTSPC